MSTEKAVASRDRCPRRLTFMASGLAAKRLALPKEAVPKISRVLVLSYLIDPIAAPQIEELEGAARSLGMKLLVRNIRNADDLMTAFDAGARERSYVQCE